MKSFCKIKYASHLKTLRSKRNLDPLRKLFCPRLKCNRLKFNLEGWNYHLLFFTLATALSKWKMRLINYSS